MKIVRVETWRDSIPLSRPYVIATQSTSAVELFFARIVPDHGEPGIGSGSPSEVVTGESADATAAALDAGGLTGLLRGRDARLERGTACRAVEATLRSTPAACAAVDIALWDLFARARGSPLADLLGRRHHERLQTSITIGIKDPDATAAEAAEYVGRGFRCLKVKLGHDFETDVERLRRLRATLGKAVRIRVDANQGYTAAETLRLLHARQSLDLEFVEQPMPVDALAEIRALPAALRRFVALDESLICDRDAIALTAEPVPAGIWVVKLMKCGGVTAALRQAAIADGGGRELMWGCMDESRISIAAALHAAYASPATRYLDLDGSFDLARDPAVGGFTVEDGALVLTGEPGLGVRLCG